MSYFFVLCFEATFFAFGGEYVVLQFDDAKCVYHSCYFFVDLMRDQAKTYVFSTSGGASNGAPPLADHFVSPRSWLDLVCHYIYIYFS